MANTKSRLELESYLRLNHASHREWQGALRTLYGASDIRCDFFSGEGDAGAISALDCDAGQLVWVRARKDVIISGWQDKPLVAVALMAGQAELAWEGQPWKRLETPVVVFHLPGFRLRLSGNSDVVFLRPDSGLLPRLPASALQVPEDLKSVIESYLFRARMFVSDRQARSLTTDLLKSFAGALVTGKFTGLPVLAPTEFDRRLVRAIEKIRLEPEWDFDLQELASHAGVSERNLYYLMKRQAGMTPYRYFQRCRLLRVRQRLVDCQCPVPHISWYAADEGFSHLGRFSALYREHFGELPSETVNWRRRLLIRDRETTASDPVA